MLIWCVLDSLLVDLARFHLGVWRGFTCGFGAEKAEWRRAAGYFGPEICGSWFFWLLLCAINEYTDRWIFLDI